MEHDVLPLVPVRSKGLGREEEAMKKLKRESGYEVAIKVSNFLWISRGQPRNLQGRARSSAAQWAGEIDNHGGQTLQPTGSAQRPAQDEVLIRIADSPRRAVLCA